MRSGLLEFPINRNVDLAKGISFDSKYVYKVSVESNGSFTVAYRTKEGADFEKYHLDTDEGFTLFVDLVNRSGRADLAAEIRASIGA